MSAYLAIFVIALGLLIITSSNIFSGITGIDANLPEAQTFVMVGFLLIFIGILMLILIVVRKIFGEEKGEKAKAETKYLCFYCEREFKTREEMDAHLKIEHKKEFKK
jgi:hypothetical protein